MAPCSDWGESHAFGPDSEYEGILHWLPEIVEDASADNSPLLQPNHRLDSVFSGGGSFAENWLGYIAEDMRRRRQNGSCGQRCSLA